MYALLVATLAGLCTGIGSAFAFFIKRLKSWQLALILGFSAGVMTYVSFAGLLAHAVEQGGLLRANIGFFIGFVLIAMLDLVIPHQYKAERLDSKHPLLKKIRRMGQKAAAEPADNRSSQYSSLERTGVFTALGIAIHNLPEGITVSVPIKEATGSSKMAFLISFASGLTEPLGALLGYLVLSPFLTPSFIAGLLAFAAGIMIYISLDELIPAALQYGTAHLMILGIGLGMVVMAISAILVT